MDVLDSEIQQTENSEIKEKKPFVSKIPVCGCVQYRWTERSGNGVKRHKNITHLCEIYGLQPSPRLFDRFMDDISEVKQLRFEKELKKIQLENELKGVR